MTTLSEKLTAILAAKADIKAAIEAKGVDLTAVPFDEYADKIELFANSSNSHKIVKEELASYEVVSTRLSTNTYNEAEQKVYWNSALFLMTEFGWELPEGTYTLYIDNVEIDTKVWDASSTYCLFDFEPMLMSNFGENKTTIFKIVKTEDAVKMRSGANCTTFLFKHTTGVFSYQQAKWGSGYFGYVAPFIISGYNFLIEAIS